MAGAAGSAGEAGMGGSTPAGRPNIVVIYADDMGFGDVGAYGTHFGTPSPAPTPRMDALAAEGMMI
jgi:arylsulfatase A-like enzyme